jgi:putative ATPase
VIGQRHLLAPGMPLAAALGSGHLPSMILWGPPGVGKTTLARLLAQAAGARIIAISAVLSGVKEIREAIEQARAAARSGRRTVLFVDEVHRFNRAQQDAFLPHVESGLVTFIGATTENPSFEVNAALLSRATVHVLRPLDEPELGEVVDRALAAMAPLPPVDPAARDLLVAQADGDARRAIGLVEQVAASARSESLAAIDAPGVLRALAARTRRFDKGGDAFYDQISALHKSVRGSAPDAAIYWLARMLDGGADPRYLARRIVRMAIEDVGLADPRAWQIALDAAQTWERLGSPEGDLALANAVLYLAAAAKSDAAYRAWGRARELVATDGSRPVPMHLRNAPTRLLKTLGHGEGYRHAHDESGGYAPGQQYLPDGLHGPQAPVFYRPVSRGLEAAIGERLSALRELDTQARGRAADPSDLADPAGASAVPGARGD